MRLIQESSAHSLTQTQVNERLIPPWVVQGLRWFNLRPEEGKRTFLMFAFYTLSSVGILWLEVSIAALFLNEYGAEWLPWVYIASAAIGTGLGIGYAWLQKVLPLHRVLVCTAGLMALPLLLFRLGLHPALMGSYTVFLMRLWLEAIYVISELNTSIAANQLFTIREIKRTYPLISSGILVADVLSGLSLPLLRGLVGLSNVILLASLMLFLGAGVLLYLTKAYRPFFPDSRYRSSNREQRFTCHRLRKPQRQYVMFVFAFFALVQVLALLLDFQYLGQLQQSMSLETIADFLALFSAILGSFELVMQWFISGRLIERLGIFTGIAVSPVLLLGLGLLTFGGVISLLVGVILLKFVDELLRYTLVASTGPLLFQPIPEANRNRIQSVVRGIAEPVSTGAIGVGLVLTLGFLQLSHPIAQTLSKAAGFVFLAYTVLFSLLWLLTVIHLRAKYLVVLVSSSDRGQLSRFNVDLPTLKRNLIEALQRATTDEERSSCIKLLTDVDPTQANAVLAPLLSSFSPALQRQSLVAMLHFPNPVYLSHVQALVTQPPQPISPEVLALALRYRWLSDQADVAQSEVAQLKPYLRADVEPVVRSTAAALMLRHGNSVQKAEATTVLRRMLTSKQEQDRIMGCQALGDAVYLQSLRLYIKPMLQDPSLPVRCAMLEAIAATHLEEYYPALLRGLSYPSTREAAQRSLVRLGDEVLPRLVAFAEHPHTPSGVRIYAWNTVGQIATSKAIDYLINRLTTTNGTTQRTVLRVLLRIPHEAGVEAVLTQLGRRGIEHLIFQQIQWLAHVYAGLVDLQPLQLQQFAMVEAELLWRALRDAETDAVEQIFLLMRFLYDANQIQAAAFNLQSKTRDSMARGLEILDNTIDLSSKTIILTIFDRLSDHEKLQHLAPLINYRSLKPSQRLHHLLELRHFLSDWTLACCFHLARQTGWTLTSEQILFGLCAASGFVREAALAYLQVVFPTRLRSVLPLFKTDPDRLVALQVRQMMAELRNPVHQ
jgi:HEAT repeat protein